MTKNHRWKAVTGTGNEDGTYSEEEVCERCNASRTVTYRETDSQPPSAPICRGRIRKTVPDATPPSPPPEPQAAPVENSPTA